MAYAKCQIRRTDVSPKHGTKQYICLIHYHLHPEVFWASFIPKECWYVRWKKNKPVHRTRMRS